MAMGIVYLASDGIGPAGLRQYSGDWQLASEVCSRHDPVVKARITKRGRDRAARSYRQLAGARGLDDAERWQHALFFAMSPQERCHFSLQTARSALSLRRFAKKT